MPLEALYVYKTIAVTLARWRVDGVTVSHEFQLWL
jgi:hypothetical protein